MKRYRVKVVGLGLALLAGHLRAGDDPLPGRPAAAPASPALLPPAVRAGEWAVAGAGEVNALWLPARKPIGAQPAPAPAPVVTAVTPSVGAGSPPMVVTPASNSATADIGPAAGPRMGSIALAPGSLPEIPAIPAAPPVPATPSAPQVPVSGASTGTTARPALPVDRQDWRPVPGTFNAPTPVPGGETPPVVNAPAPGPMAAESPAFAPRIETPAVEPRADLPVAGPRVVVESQVGADPVPGTMPARAPGEPLPPPRPVPSRDMPPTPGTQTPSRPAEPQTSPRPVEPQYGYGYGPAVPVERELPVAPPELLIPAGVTVPGHHGTFGSPPVSISKDYPPLSQLLGLDGSWLASHRGNWLGRSDDTAGGPPTDRFDFRAELLMWWVNPQRIPVLASTSVNGGLGFLGDPGTRTLLGPGTFGDPLRLGMRMRAGWWFDDCGTCGIDAGFFFLGRQTSSAAFDSGTYPTITRPFFAPNFNSEFGEIVALPGFSSGRLSVDATSSIWGFDVNLRHALCRTCDFRAEVFAGYRFLGLDESLTITENITALPGNTNDPAGTSVVVQDRFQTRNRFNGGQLGFAAERRWGRVSLDGRMSVALGDTTQTVDISGSQSRLRPGMATPDVFAGGLLATGPNLGHFSRDRFSVVPELTANLGYWVTPTLKVYAGYNLLYWSNVIRPGDQIDRVVDVSLVPNPPAGVAPSGQLRPQPTFRQSDLWLNGIQFGVEWRW